MHVQKPVVSSTQHDGLYQLTHGSISLSDTSTNTSQHTRGSGADTKALDRVLFNFGRSENENSSLGRSFNPCLLSAHIRTKGQIELTHGIKPW
jgi:hypothetical protein